MKDKKTTEKAKSAKTELGKTIEYIIPMAEELAEYGAIPFCVMGWNSKPKKGEGQLFFSTINDGKIVEDMLFMASVAYVQLFNRKYPDHTYSTPAPRPIQKQPISKLAKDKEMCKQIAMLLGMEYHSSEYIDEMHSYVVICVHDNPNIIIDFTIFSDGQFTYDDTTGIPNCVKICELISSKYNFK